MERDLDAVVARVVEEVLGGQSSQPSCGAPLTKGDAERLARAVFAKARETGVRAVVCVSDAGGHPLLLEREEDAYIASLDIAANKAYTAVALQMSTSDLAELAAPGGSLYGIQFTNGGKIVIFGGGEPLKRGNAIVGGFGVSGGTAEQDTALGRFAAAYFAKEMQ